MLRKLVGAAAMAVALAGCETAPSTAAAPACRPPLVAGTMIDLYFGRTMPGGAQVSDMQWNEFLRSVITPRFPDGLTVIDAYGQSGSKGGRVTPERAKVVQIGVKDGAAASVKVEEVIAEYKQRFRQVGVFRVEYAMCASF